MTIHHLLTHTSGIPDYTDLYEYGQIEIEWCREHTTEQVNAFFNQEPLIFASGSQWRYSNSGYFLLGEILENVSNQSYEIFLQENILQPLVGWVSVTVIRPQVSWTCPLPFSTQVFHAYTLPFPTLGLAFFDYRSCTLPVQMHTFGC